MYFALLAEVLGGGDWEVGVCVGDGGNDVILASVDASLGLVAAMLSRRSEFWLEILVVEHGGEHGRDLIVHTGDGAASSGK
jgi:hypothetical protein